MSEIVSRVANAAGVDEALAQKAIDVLLDLVREHAPSEKVKALFEALPDTDPATVPDTPSAGGGMLGGLGGLGGMLGGLGGAAGAMGALNDLNSAGLSMDQIKVAGREVLDYSKEHAGEDLVNDVVGSIPGLKQIL